MTAENQVRGNRRYVCFHNELHEGSHGIFSSRVTDFRAGLTPETGITPLESIVVDGVRCRLLRHEVQYIGKPVRRVIAEYEEATTIDAELAKIDLEESRLWQWWEANGKPEHALQQILMCVDARKKVLALS